MYGSTDRGPNTGGGIQKLIYKLLQFSPKWQHHENWAATQKTVVGNSFKLSYFDTNATPYLLFSESHFCHKMKPCMQLPSFNVMYHNCLDVILVKISAPISCKANLSKSVSANASWMCVQSLTTGWFSYVTLQWLHHLMSCVTTACCPSHVGPDLSAPVFLTTPLTNPSRPTPVAYMCV